MASNLDLVIRGGTVVDGTGAKPIEADVAISGGRITAIGKVSASGREEIDAKGLLVTPGFVDIHTHYDGQAIWDTHMAPSAWHGVTTAVMGNCGVGFAPCKPTDMEGVEDIPGAVMHEGLKWEWESFGEYLDALDRRHRDIDVCALLPHAAVRVYVMGERAIRLEPANQGDVAEMRRITAEAVRAGAFGVSTSRTTSHKSLTGEYTPTLRALEAELTGLAQGLGDAKSGFLEVVSEWTQPNPAEEFAMLRRVVEASGRNAVFTLAQRNNGPVYWPDLLRYAGEAIKAGTSIRPVIPPRAIGLLLGLEGSQNPFSGTRSYCKIAKLSIAERVAAMRDPDFRRQLLADDPKEFSTFPLFHRMSYDQMFRFGHPPDYTPKREDAISAIAARESRTPQEVAYDIMLENEGHGFIYAPIVNYGSYDLSISETQLADPNTIMGLGDGGAHVGFILDAGFQTWLLNYWGRTRRRFPVEELVRRLTSDPAGAAGLGDRGVLAAGKKADVNLIDYDRLSYEAPHVAYDLPAGGKRLLQRAKGYAATIVSGAVTYRDGEATGALPGRLVRGQPTP
jgi:N-acyl-D-aspartate/D-glutamate deacylase